MNTTAVNNVLDLFASKLTRITDGKRLLIGTTRQDPWVLGHLQSGNLIEQRLRDLNAFGRCAQAIFMAPRPR